MMTSAASIPSQDHGFDQWCEVNGSAWYAHGIDNQVAAA
jgi:hypothetical protein